MVDPVLLPGQCQCHQQKPHSAACLRAGPIRPAIKNSFTEMQTHAVASEWAGIPGTQGKDRVKCKQSIESAFHLGIRALGSTPSPSSVAKFQPKSEPTLLCCSRCILTWLRSSAADVEALQQTAWDAVLVGRLRRTCFATAVLPAPAEPTITVCMPRCRNKLARKAAAVIDAVGTSGGACCVGDLQKVVMLSFSEPS